jgi:hypothetical protein
MRAMRRGRGWGYAWAIAVGMVLFGCKHAPARVFEVAVPESPGSAADPATAYKLVVDLLAQNNYRIMEQNEPARSVRVRALSSGDDPSKASFITADVEPDGKRIVLRPSGSSVKKDGSASPRLESEILVLEGKLQERLGAAPAASPAPMAKAPSEPSSPAVVQVRLDMPPPSASNSLPSTWNEDAYTCLSVQLPTDVRQLRLRLSTGQDADVSLSIGYLPGACRSASECHLPGGCPALGLSDSEKVSQLAHAIAGGQIGPQATLMLEGRAVAVVNLATHGSVSQAMRQR